MWAEVKYVVLAVTYLEGGTQLLQHFTIWDFNIPLSFTSILQHVVNTIFKEVVLLPICLATGLDCYVDS